MFRCQVLPVGLRNWRILMNVLALPSRIHAAGGTWRLLGIVLAFSVGTVLTVPFAEARITRIVIDPALSSPPHSKDASSGRMAVWARTRSFGARPTARSTLPIHAMR